MDKPETVWFKNIIKPDLDAGQSGGYLDRLTGCNDPKDRQYLANRKTKRNGKHKPNKSKIPNEIIKKSINCKLNSVVDDAKWIEERKKRFPKKDSEGRTQIDRSSMNCDIKHGENSTFRRNEHHNNQSKRNLSLFEQLMDDTDDTDPTH